MDKIKFDFAYCPTFGTLYSVISVNGQDLAELIEKEEQELLSNGKIGFVSKYEGVPPNELLKGLLSKNEWIVILCHREYYYYLVVYVTCLETQNSIIWNDIQNPRRRKFGLPLSSFLDGIIPKNIPTDNTGLGYSFHFEFDKKQYYQAIGYFIGKLIDASYDIEKLIPCLSIIETKRINSKGLQKAMLEEQCYLLEGYLLPKRKNDRKQIKMIH